jgi:hypothetical protein
VTARSRYRCAAGFHIVGSARKMSPGVLAAFGFCAGQTAELTARIWSLPSVRHVLDVWAEALALAGQSLPYKSRLSGLVVELHLRFLPGKKAAG